MSDQEPYRLGPLEVYVSTCYAAFLVGVTWDAMLHEFHVLCGPWDVAFGWKAQAAGAGD